MNLTQKLPANFNDTKLKETVQHNCNLSDALHATNYSLCVYLLKMREYFRWEKGYGFDEPLPKEELAAWMSQREKFWDDIADHAYLPLQLADNVLDPFEDDAINHLLLPQGLVYSGGIGHAKTPHFFLGQLECQTEYANYPVFIAGTEQARNLTAPPAMSTCSTIFIRRESLKRMLWEKLAEWRWNQLPGMMEKALSFYDFDHALDESLEAMCEQEINTLILHEAGEMQASACLGEDWRTMLSQLSRSRTEMIVRAVKDLFADMLVTLPQLLKERATASLYFYFANQSPMRKHLFPMLMHSAREWDQTGDYTKLIELNKRAEAHWRHCAQQMLECFRQAKEGKQLDQAIETYALTQAL